MHGLLGGFKRVPWCKPSKLTKIEIGARQRHVSGHKVWVFLNGFLTMNLGFSDPVMLVRHPREIARHEIVLKSLRIYRACLAKSRELGS